MVTSMRSRLSCRSVAVLLLALAGSGCDGDNGAAPAGVRQCERDGCDTGTIWVNPLSWSADESAVILAGAQRWHSLGFDVQPAPDEAPAERRIDVVPGDDLPLEVSGRVSQRPDGTRYIRIRTGLTLASLRAVASHEMGHVLISSRHLAKGEAGIMVSDMAGEPAPAFSADDYAWACRHGKRCVARLAARVRGRVVDQSGVPFVGASVTISGGPFTSRESQPSDSLGDYQTGYLALGTYQLACAAPRYIGQSVAVTLVVPDEVRDVACTVSDLAEVEGTVRDPGGQPIEGATVRDTAGGSGAVTSTGADGGYHLAGLHASRLVVIEARRPGYERVAASLTLDPGTRLRSDLAMLPGGRVQVHASSPTGVALDGVQIQVTTPGLPYPGGGPTIGGGNFLSDWTRAGIYSVECRGLGDPALDLITGVVVRAGETTEVTCVVGPWPGAP